MSSPAAEPDATQRHLPGTSGYRRLNLAMVGAGLAAFGLLYVTQPVLPEIADTYGVSASVASLTVSASTGALALAVIPVTALSARWGRVRTMRTGLLVAAALGVASAFAPNVEILIGLRTGLGLVLAGVIAVAMGHVGAEVHPSGVGSAMGLYVAGNTLGGVSGRVVTAATADLADWRVGVLVFALLSLAATALFWWLLPPAANDARPARTEHLFRQALGQPSILLLALVPFCLMGGFVAVYNYLTFRLVAAPFSLPVALVGLVFLAYLAGTVSSASGGRAADRWGRARIFGLSAVVMLGGLLLTVPAWLPSVVLGLVVFTAGFFAAHAVASGWAPLVAGRLAAQASALYVLGYYAGSSLFGAAVGSAWSAYAWGGVVVCVAALILVALGCAGVVTWRGRQAPAPPRGTARPPRR